MHSRLLEKLAVAQVVKNFRAGCLKESAIRFYSEPDESGPNASRFRNIHLNIRALISSGCLPYRL